MIARYHLLRRLGKGSTANVNMCIDSQTKLPIILKEIPRGRYGDQEFANEVFVNTEVSCDEIVKIVG
jgi:serine/threonine protein kinase